MGNAITTAGNNNLLGLFGLQDALMHMFPDFHNDVAKHLALQSVVMPGAPFLCGGAYGRRKRSARRNLMKKMKRSPSLQKLVLDMVSSKEGIDNEAFEIDVTDIGVSASICYDQFYNCMETSALRNANEVFVDDKMFANYYGKYKTTAQMRSYQDSVKKQNKACKMAFEECLQQSLSISK